MTGISKITRIDRKKVIIMLSVVAVAAIMSGTVLTIYAADVAENGEEPSNNPAGCWNGRFGLGRGRCFYGRIGCGRRGFLEVNEEFKENVIEIAESDEDVEGLLDDEYEIIGVKPIIRARVEADGEVVEGVTTAFVMLKKEGTGRASVWVDLEEGKVTRIVILTRTVIEKS